MPIRDDFKEIAEIIRATAKDCGLEYVPGDLSKKPGSVMRQILLEISRAAVVVADITGHNPNVFYELGIAHQIKRPERVVIITQQIDDKKAFDIHQYQQLVYTHNTDGRDKLRKELPELIKEALKASNYHETWNIIRGTLPRTNLIISDLKRLINTSSSKKLKNTTIRIVATLSSISISDHEPSDYTLGVDYHKALILERNTLIKALLKGVRLKIILTPPHRFAKSMLPDRLSMRYKRLIGLLEGKSEIETSSLTPEDDLKAIKQCDIVLTPVSTPNFFIIGDEVAYEGMKRTGSGGFDITHCETSTEGMEDIIKKFDKFFKESHDEMISTHPPDGRLVEQLKKFYAEAMSYAKM